MGAVPFGKKVAWEAHVQSDEPVPEALLVQPRGVRAVLLPVLCAIVSCCDASHSQQHARGEHALRVLGGRPAVAPLRNSGGDGGAHVLSRPQQGAQRKPPWG